MDVSETLIGILSRECAVVPPSSRLAAMPEVATAIASPPAARTVANRTFSRKVFPQPAAEYSEGRVKLQAEQNNYPA